MKGKTVLKIMLVIVASLLLFEVLALVKLKLDINGYKHYWQNRAQKPAKTASIAYVALGDSAAQGLGAGIARRGYVGLIADELAKQSSEPIQTINLSVSGAKIKDVTEVQLPQLKKLTDKYPTMIITMDIGANEMRVFNAQSFRKDMDTLLRQLPQQTVVAEVPYFGGGRFRKYEKNVPAANSIIHELANSYGLKVAPLYEITKTRDSLMVYAADLFHPSNTGYKNWYEAFRQALNF